MTNHYLEALAKLQELAPDLQAEIDELCIKYDAPPNYTGPGHKEDAREVIAGLIDGWITDLQELKNLMP